MVDIAAAPESERALPTLEHGDVIAALIAALRPYVLSHRLGRVFAPQTTYHRRRFNANDTLTGDPVIPGFVLPVSELFTWG